MIEFEAAEKKYGPMTYAVKNINLTINEGEFVCVIGTSGSGKTTLMRMINRMVDPTSGMVKIKGKNNRNYNEDELRRQIGYVIQNIGLFPHLTIRENIMIVPKLLKWTDEQKKGVAEKLMERVELPIDYLDRKPRNLSGGQQQRIGVIRALAANQDIILMDEPFGALDPITRESLQNLIKKLQQQLKKTIVFVTHDMDEALKLADPILVMSQGEVVQFAPPNELVEKPANDFVQELIGKSNRTEYYNNEILVKQIMKQNVASISLSKSVIDAIQKMKEKKVDRLFVVDDEKRLKGYIDIDAINKNINSTTSVYEIMQTKTTSITENEKMKRLIYPLLNGTLKTIPVLDNESRLTGIITRSSLVELIYEQID